MNTGSNPVGVAAASSGETNTKETTTEQNTSALARVWPKCDGREFPGKGAVVEVRNATGWEVREVRRRGSDKVGPLFRITGDDVLSQTVHRPTMFGVLWRWVDEDAALARLHECAEGLRAEKKAEVCAPFAAETKCEKCGDYKPCRCGAGLQDATALDDVRPEEVDPEKENEIAALAVLDAGLGAICATHGKNGLLELPIVRTCAGVPIYQGPAEACDTILGADVQGNRCSACAEWMRSHGQCDGCNGRLPGWQVTGHLCADHRAIRQAAIREQKAEAEQAEQPNDKRKPVAEVLDFAYEDFYAALWEMLAMESGLDRATVEACKRVRDDERAVRGRR
jgi:hypothetical protein